MVRDLNTLAMLACLTPYEREVVVDHFLRGETYRTIAARHGVTAQAAQMTCRRALARIRDAHSEKATA